MQPELYFKVKNKFSAFPGLARMEDSDYSGEEFRETILIPALLNYNKVFLDFTGCHNIIPSFIREISYKVMDNNILTEKGFTVDLENRVLIISDDVDFINDFYEFIKIYKKEHGMN
jgi:hypothetical protein